MHVLWKVAVLSEYMFYIARLFAREARVKSGLREASEGVGGRSRKNGQWKNREARFGAEVRGYM